MLRPLHRGMRPLLIAFSILTIVATNQLYVLTAKTWRYFAWTISPHLSATFLGAGYAAGFVLVVTTLRATTWPRARLPVLTVLVFTVLTLIATLLSTGPFHFGASVVIARLAAWFWLAVYVIVPTWMLVLLGLQHRLAASLPEPVPDPPPRWLRVVLGVQAVALTTVGIILFVAPATERALWPWHLSALTARTIAAWLISFGIAAGIGAFERQLDRVRNAAFAYALFAVLQLAALPRYSSDIRWKQPATTGYLVALASILLAGCAGWWLAGTRQTGASRAGPRARVRI